MFQNFLSKNLILIFCSYYMILADNGNVAQEEDDDTNERKMQTQEEFHDSGLSNIQNSNAQSSHISRGE